MRVTMGVVFLLDCYVKYTLVQFVNVLRAMSLLRIYIRYKFYIKLLICQYDARNTDEFLFLFNKLEIYYYYLLLFIL